MSERRISRLTATVFTVINLIGCAAALTMGPPPEGSGMFAVFAGVGVAALVVLRPRPGAPGKK